MSLEKLLAGIEARGNKECERILADAETACRKIAEQAQLDAARISKEILERADPELEMEKTRRWGEMELQHIRRRAEEKHNILEEAFSEAKARLEKKFAENKADYLDLLLKESACDLRSDIEDGATIKTINSVVSRKLLKFDNVLEHDPLYECLEKIIKKFFSEKGSTWLEGEPYYQLRYDIIELFQTIAKYIPGKENVQKNTAETKQLTLDTLLSTLKSALDKANYKLPIPDSGYELKVADECLEMLILEALKDRKVGDVAIRHFVLAADEATKTLVDDIIKRIDASINIETAKVSDFTGVVIERRLFDKIGSLLSKPIIITNTMESRLEKLKDNLNHVVGNKLFGED